MLTLMDDETDCRGQLTSHHDAVRLLLATAKLSRIYAIMVPESNYAICAIRQSHFAVRFGSHN